MELAKDPMIVDCVEQLIGPDIILWGCQLFCKPGTDGMEEKLLARTPLGRLVETYEVADAIHFLASDAAAMITGHTLPVDGGWVAQ